MVKPALSKQLFPSNSKQSQSLVLVNGKPKLMNWLFDDFKQEPTQKFNPTLQPNTEKMKNQQTFKNAKDQKTLKTKSILNRPQNTFTLQETSRKINQNIGVSIDTLEPKPLLQMKSRFNKHLSIQKEQELRKEQIKQQTLKDELIRQKNNILMQKTKQDWIDIDLEDITLDTGKTVVIEQSKLRTGSCIDQKQDKILNHHQSKYTVVLPEDSISHQDIKCTIKSKLSKPQKQQKNTKTQNKRTTRIDEANNDDQRNIKMYDNYVQDSSQQNIQFDDIDDSKIELLDNTQDISDNNIKKQKKQKDKKQKDNELTTINFD
eukprot:403339897